MLKIMAFICLVAAGMCVLPPALGSFADGQWQWHDMTIGHMLRVGSGTFSGWPRIRQIADVVLPINVVWAFLGLATLFAILDGAREKE